MKDFELCPPGCLSLENLFYFCCHQKNDFIRVRRFFTRDFFSILRTFSSSEFSLFWKIHVKLYNNNVLWSNPQSKWRKFSVACFPSELNVRKEKRKVSRSKKNYSFSKTSSNEQRLFSTFFHGFNVLRTSFRSFSSSFQQNVERNASRWNGFPFGEKRKTSIGWMSPRKNEETFSSNLGQWRRWTTNFSIFRRNHRDEQFHVESEQSNIDIVFLE